MLSKLSFCPLKLPKSLETAVNFNYDLLYTVICVNNKCFNNNNYHIFFTILVVVSLKFYSFLIKV